MHLSCNLYGLVDVGEVWEYEKEAFVCLCSLKVAIVAIKIVCVFVCVRSLYPVYSGSALYNCNLIDYLLQ